LPKRQSPRKKAGQQVFGSESTRPTQTGLNMPGGLPVAGLNLAVHL